MLRVGLFALLLALRSAEGGKAAKKLDLGDATLLVLDGLTEDGMKLANEVLSVDGTNVNVEVEMDDGSKGTPLGVASMSTSTAGQENCMDLVRLLLQRKATDVNAAVVGPDGSKVPPLMLAMKAITAGMPVGVELAKALLSHDQIDVNAVQTAGDGGLTKLAPLHMALAAAARGNADGKEIARALLARSDTNTELEMIGPDGTKMAPLMKLASMLQEQPSDANLRSAVLLLHARAKPLEDEKMQKVVEAAVEEARKDEL